MLSFPSAERSCFTTLARRMESKKRKLEVMFGLQGQRLVAGRAHLYGCAPRL